jgi:hypothetical protein
MVRASNAEASATTAPVTRFTPAAATRRASARTGAS